MLLPFEFAIITKKEVITLINFIQKATETKTKKENLEKITKLGMSELYEKLKQFICECDKHTELQNLDTESIQYLDRYSERHWEY